VWCTYVYVCYKILLWHPVARLSIAVSEGVRPFVRFNLRGVVMVYVIWLTLTRCYGVRHSANTYKMLWCTSFGQHLQDILKHSICIVCLSFNLISFIITKDKNFLLLSFRLKKTILPVPVPVAAVAHHDKNCELYGLTVLIPFSRTFTSLNARHQFHSKTKSQVEIFVVF
jgi:hypothetical protein